MAAYILRRLVLIIPTLWGIVTINFFIVQAAPGGPVEQMIARLQGDAVGATERFTGSDTGEVGRSEGDSQDNGVGLSRGARGLDPELVAKIEKLYGFDEPLTVLTPPSLVIRRTNPTMPQVPSSAPTMLTMDCGPLSSIAFSIASATSVMASSQPMRSH